jgi:predicted alpha/beta-hydrolase family hydrolase
MLDHNRFGRLRSDRNNFYISSMKPGTLKINVGGSSGEVSAAVIASEKSKVVMVLAHGAGAPMSHPFMTKLSEELEGAGVATLRFNFPYMEQGKKRPDVPAVAHKTISAAIACAEELFPGIPIVCAGKSFGGRMSSQLLSKEHIASVKAIVFYGFPLHPTNAPGVERAEHLASVRVPMLFLQGSRDSLAELSLIKNVTSALPLATLEVFEGADHSFKAGKKDFIVDLSKKTETWLKGLTIL